MILIADNYFEAILTFTITVNINVNVAIEMSKLLTYRKLSRRILKKPLAQRDISPGFLEMQIIPECHGTCRKEK